MGTQPKIIRVQPTQTILICVQIGAHNHLKTQIILCRVKKIARKTLMNTDGETDRDKNRLCPYLCPTVRFSIRSEPGRSGTRSELKWVAGGETDIGVSESKMKQKYMNINTKNELNEGQRWVSTQVNEAQKCFVLTLCPDALHLSLRAG